MLQGRKKTIIKASKEVILSAGTIGSPYLLLLSGIGPAKHLKKVNVDLKHNLPGVGRNFQDHVSYSLHYTIKEGDFNPLNRDAFDIYKKSRNGPMSARDVMSATIKIASPYSNGTADLQFYFESALMYCSKTGSTKERLSSGRKTLNIIAVMLNPQSRGFLELKSNNHLDYPKIVGNFLSHDTDKLIHVYGVKFAQKLIESNALKKYQPILRQSGIDDCKCHELYSDDFWRCMILDGYRHDNHQAGTCKMGPAKDEMAVVSSRLKVHGIKSLRVIDCSIMPEVVSGNTHAPAMLIGEMGSHFIAKDWA